MGGIILLFAILIFSIWMMYPMWSVGMEMLVSTINGTEVYSIPVILIQLTPLICCILAFTTAIVKSIKNHIKRTTIINQYDHKYVGTIVEVHSRYSGCGRNKHRWGEIVVGFDKEGTEILCKFDIADYEIRLYYTGMKVTVYEKNGEFAWDRKVLYGGE